MKLLADEDFDFRVREQVVMVMSDKGSRIDVWSDICEHFEFIEEKLVYMDAPLEGFLRARTGELFAFRCAAIVAGCLWHWVLLPVEAVGCVKDVFEAARTLPPKEWVSIVEDRRDQPRLSAARLTGGVHEIPRSAF